MQKLILAISFLLISLTGNLGAREIFYGVSPFYYVRGYNQTFFPSLTKRLPELKELGIDVVWIGPIFPSAEPGQGYDTVDFFSIDPQFGTPAEFRTLVNSAHTLGMKIILDIALNHTSIMHPEAQDVIKKGTNSPFYDFYQHEKLNVPYQQFFNVRTENTTDFIFYFWDKLINLNYSSSLVQKRSVDILKYWIVNFNIDGYRLDASWGPSSRWNEFYPVISSELKKHKKNLILLAEDKAAYPELYKDYRHPHLRNSGFTHGYDWNSEDPHWLSKWSFQNGDEHSDTLFNLKDKKLAAKTFAEILEHQRKSLEVTPLRFIENNDTGSFLQHHTQKQTRFAAAIMFLLPGSPLIYAGQEAGLNYPQWHIPSLDPEVHLSSIHPSFYKFYLNLISLRKSLNDYKEITELKLIDETQVHITVDHVHNVMFDFRKSVINLNGKNLPFTL